MCGIVAYLSSSNTVAKRKYEDIMAQLLVVDSLRGPHSTGIMYDAEDGVYTYKRPVAGYDFVQLTETEKALNLVNRRFLIGHNRWATVGAHTADNAHPFTMGDITGVHNGTLVGGYRSLCKGNHDVDSQYLIAALSEAKSSKEVISKVNGSFNLLWYDARDDSIHMVRNKERPWYIAKVKDDDVIFGASEAKMLKWVCDRNEIEIETIMSPNPYYEHVYPLDDINNPHVIKHEEYKSPYTSYPNNHNRNTGGYQNNSGNSGKKAAGKNVGQQKRQPNNNNVTNLLQRSLTELTEFCAKQFIPNTNLTISQQNSGLTYGRVLGKTMDDQDVIVYQCLEDELQIGAWYEGLYNPKDMFDGRFTVQRTTIKKMSGKKGQDLYSCSECDEMFYAADIIFVTKTPICFECAKHTSDAEDKKILSPKNQSKGVNHIVH